MGRKPELVRSKRVLVRKPVLVRSKLEQHRSRNVHDACGTTCATIHHGTSVHMDHRHRKQVLELVHSKQVLAHNMNRNRDPNRRTSRLLRWLRSRLERKQQSKLRK